MGRYNRLHLVSMNLPLYSCVVPVKGKRPYLADSLSSLVSQEMGDQIEVIVQDGDIEIDGGQSDALNRGFAKARGEWLFWLNADDVLLPGALGKIRDFIGRVECVEGEEVKGKVKNDSRLATFAKVTAAKKRVDRVDWIAGNQLLIDGEGKVLKCSVGNGWHDWLYRHAVPHVYGPSSFFRRELFERVGGLDVSLKYCMDWDLWIKFMKAGARFERIGDYLWAQRQWSGSKTQREKSEEEESAQWAEISSMLSRNKVDVSCSGSMMMRMWRFLHANVMRQVGDGLRFEVRHYAAARA